MRKPRTKPVKLEALATMVRRSVYSAYRNTLIGGAPPIVRDAYERMTKPTVGDLVIETSTVYGMRHPHAADLDGVGILESVAWEPVMFSDPEFVWDETVEGQPHPHERVHYIRTFDGRLFRWTNANFVAAQTELPVSGLNTPS